MKNANIKAITDSINSIICTFVAEAFVVQKKPPIVENIAKRNKKGILLRGTSDT